MIGWQDHGADGVRLTGLNGLTVVLTPLAAAWSVTVRVDDSDVAYTAIRDTYADARDLALERALALYPAVLELAYRRELEGDPGDMAECRRVERDLLIFALSGGSAVG